MKKIIGCKKEIIIYFFALLITGLFFGNNIIQCSGDWKLIYYYEDKSVELFNLKDDLSEEHDLSRIHSDKRKELYVKLMDWLLKTQAPIPTELNPDYVAVK